MIQPSPDAVVEGVAAEVCVVDLDLSAVVEVGAVLVVGETVGVDCAELPAQPLNMIAKPLTMIATRIVVEAFFMDS